MDSEMENGVVLKGYHKKLKTMKKKYFVLYNETPHGASRLEYFDSEKKFAQRTEPKRVIHLKNCFNINRRFDTKLKFVVVLSTREGGFGIVFDSENDLRKWLDQLLCLQRDNANITDQVNSSYDHVWQVTIQKKGISEKAGIIGSYHCCLTSKSLTFLCIEPNKPQSGANRTPKVEILLTTIRRCGHASPQCIFYMELGRQSVLGSGELWMETDDASTSRNMHDMILSAMSAKSESNMNVLNVCQGGRSDIVPEPMRKRSSSANEASKPINVLHKRQNALDIRSSISPHHYSYGRERCDSLPTRNITCIDSSNQSFIVSSSGIRSNSISGVRPQPANRYSTSSPLNTPMRCSESEESSISVDETDDTGSFSHYRLKCERPTRAYSIGSKIESSKTRQRLGYLNDLEKSSIRVRAYSVGSRAKTPYNNGTSFGVVNKDKLQLYTKGSQSNVSIKSSSERGQVGCWKYTSAPLVTADKMSDLMEIDFSKDAATHKVLISNVQETNMCNINNTWKSSINVNNNAMDNNNSLNSSQSFFSGAYLEMKPVGNISYDYNIDNVSNKVEMLKLKNSLSPQLIDDIDIKNSCHNNCNMCNRASGNLNNMMWNKGSINYAKVDHMPHQAEKPNPKLAISTSFGNRQLEAITKVDSKKINMEINDVFGVVPILPDEKRLIHSISNEDNTHSANDPIDAMKHGEVGYKMLQIKSDSSLLLTKTIQRGVCKKHIERKHRHLENMCSPMAKESGVTTTSKCNETFATFESKSKETKNQNSSLRPPSRISQPELYYASLDLPQSGMPMSSICIKQGSCDSSTAVNISPVENAYAKIDFDQSDSSSSSSKICNV
ncbi:insulin receptor substrate 1 isoform X2 [Drosophila tropicalis]|uniref:insulin receptor substrate 1 isoform X2 n=1 Tax=Drosophila tropicalis TaxID=46794 RepID=UPI0035AB90B6